MRIFLTACSSLIAIACGGCHTFPQSMKPPDSERPPLGYYDAPFTAQPDSVTARIVGIRVATGGLLLDSVTDATKKSPLFVASRRAQSRGVEIRDEKGEDILFFPFQPHRRGGNWKTESDAKDYRLSKEHPEWSILTIPLRCRQFQVGDRVILRFKPVGGDEKNPEIVVLPTEWTES